MTPAPARERQVLPQPTLVPESVQDEPFWNEDAEQAVLSACLSFPDALLEARSVVSPESFHLRRHAKIFEAMLALVDNGRPVDPHTLCDELLAAGELGASGGKDYIIELIDAVPTGANVRYHAEIVADHSMRRRIIRASSAVAEQPGSGARVEDVRVRLLEQLDTLSVTRGRYRLYSVQDLASLPKPEDLIAGVIPMNALVGLIGAKGTMKTMAALDIALHIALGLDWQGKKVTQGGVAYVYAEGPSGAEQRVNAWFKYYEFLGFTIHRESLPIWFLPGSVAVNDPAAISELLGEIRKLPVPILYVVVDTLNRNLKGKEDDEGMGSFVAGCAKIQSELGATVMAVHHTPLSDSDRGRGHSSFDGALDTRLMVTRDDDRVTLECTHQRNGIDGWTVAFQAIPIAGSIVLKPSALDAGELKGQRREILDLLHQKGTARYAGWLRDSGLKPSSFRKARTWLLARSYVNSTAGEYAVTEAGRLALGALRAPEGTNA